MIYNVLLILLINLIIIYSSSVDAQLKEINDDQLADHIGQSGVSFEGHVNLAIENISYQQKTDGNYLMLNDIEAKFTYSESQIDVTESGSLRINLPHTINFDQLSFGLYSSKDINLDINNPDNIQTYTIYASTLGNAYDGFRLDISGVELSNGSQRWDDDYVNTDVLENNASIDFTVTEAADIKIDLESDDDGFFNEDYAQITVVDEDGNIVDQMGQAGENDTSLELHFDSPINNNFILQANLTGSFQLGGAIEVFTASNVPFKP